MLFNCYTGKTIYTCKTVPSNGLYPDPGASLSLMERLRMALSTPIIEIQLRPQGNAVGMTIPKGLREKLGKLEAGDIIGLKVCNKDSLAKLAHGMQPDDEVIVMILGAVKAE